MACAALRSNAEITVRVIKMFDARSSPVRRLRVPFADLRVLAKKRVLLSNPVLKNFDGSWRICPRGIARTGRFWKAENDELDNGVDGIRVRPQRPLKVKGSVAVRGAG